MIFLHAHRSKQSPRGIPVSLGWYNSDTSAQHNILIKPSSCLNFKESDWCNTSVSLHGFSLTEVEANGVSATAAAKQLNNLFSTEVFVDGTWMRMLLDRFFEGAAVEMNFEVINVRTLMSDEQFQQFNHSAQLYEARGSADKMAVVLFAMFQATFYSNDLMSIAINKH